MRRTYRGRCRRRSGTATSCTRADGRARPALHRPAPRARGHARRRRSTACASPAAPCAAPTSPSRRWTTTSRPRASTARSTTRSRRSRSRRCARNCEEFGIRCYAMGDPGQGIVHVIGPEQGLTQPGMTIVCGDSHTSTHGAFGALAFGIGTSEVEHVLATQTLPQMRPGTMAITVDGDLPAGVTAKDIVLAIIAPHRHRRRHRLASSSTAARRSARCRWKAA